MNQRSLKMWRGGQGGKSTDSEKNKLAVKNLHICRYLTNFHLLGF